MSSRMKQRSGVDVVGLGISELKLVINGGLDCIFFFQAEDGIRDLTVTGVQTCALPILDRLVLSALLELDHQGDLVSLEFTRGVIRSAERMTYTNVRLLLEGDKGLRERYEIGRASCRERV